MGQDCEALRRVIEEIEGQVLQASPQVAGLLMALGIELQSLRLLLS